MNSGGDIVITGMGVVSPIGIGLESFWESLINGTSGVAVRSEFEDTDIRLRLAARVADFDARKYVKPRKAIKMMCDPIRFGCAAATMAVEQSGLLDCEISPDRLGTLFGAETFFADPGEVADVFRSCIVDQDYQHERWGEFAMRKIQPLWMLKYLPNMASSHISIALDARGHSNTICQGEASGLIALIEAATVIQRGACDVMITGGTGSIAELTSMLYRGSNFSTKFNDRPELASRPFDRDRDGMVAGEGAGAIVIESAEHARKRGAKPFARLAGWSRRFGVPESDEMVPAIESCYADAMSESKTDVSKIGFVNASASGSLQMDAVEAKAIANSFPEIPVVANKSNFGNLGPGTSTVELIASILALNHQTVPQTLNFSVSDDDIDLNVTREKTSLNGTSPFGLKSAISTTGQIAAVVVDQA